MDHTSITIALGTVMPFIIEFIKKYIPNKHYMRVLASLVVSVIAGFLVSLTEGRLNPTDVLQSISIVFASAQVIYSTWFRRSNVKTKIKNFHIK